MAKAVSSTDVLVNSETSDSVNLFNFAMCTFARKCYPMQLVSCSDGWQRIWSQTIHMMQGLPVSWIPQGKLKRHKGACLELLHATGRFEPTYIEAHQASDMICKVQSLKSRIQTCSFLEDIITPNNEVCIDWESDMAVGIWMLSNSS